MLKRGGGSTYRRTMSERFDMSPRNNFKPPKIFFGTRRPWVLALVYFGLVGCEPAGRMNKQRGETVARRIRLMPTSMRLAGRLGGRGTLRNRRRCSLWRTFARVVHAQDRRLGHGRWPCEGVKPKPSLRWKRHAPISPEFFAISASYRITPNSLKFKG